MFLGWYDSDKKRPAKKKVEDAIERYQEKFGAEPEVLFCNPAHEQELDGVYILVRTVNYIPKNTFYVGFYDPIEGELAS